MSTTSALLIDLHLLAISFSFFLQQIADFDTLEDADNQGTYRAICSTGAGCLTGGESFKIDP